MNEEKTNSSLSGHSLVALIIPNQQTINDGDSSYATTEIQYIQEQIPDLRFIYYGGGSIQRFSSFVRDPTQDLFSLFTRIEMQNKTKSLSVKKMKKDTELDFSLAWERQTGLLRAKIQ